MVIRGLLVLSGLLLVGGWVGGGVRPPAEAPAYVRAYIDKISACEQESEGLQYDLIDLDGDGTPELVAGMPGYFVSLYTYGSGGLRTLMDRWAYGVFGNSGYEYLPGRNVIRNYNADLAGAIRYEYYMRVNDKDEIIPCYDEALSIWLFQDTNHNYFIDEGEPCGVKQYYYYGDREITAEAYQAYVITGDYKAIEGNKSASETVAQLQKKTASDRAAALGG